MTHTLEKEGTTLTFLAVNENDEGRTQHRCTEKIYDVERSRTLNSH